jgi:hypothetical protein
MAYHYLIGVGTNDIHSSEPGKAYLDTFFEFTDKDKENINNCRLLSNDKLFKSTVKDSAEVFGCGSIISNFQGLLIRARAQNTILLHYVSSTKLTREYFDGFVKVTSFEELRKAKIF